MSLLNRAKCAKFLDAVCCVASSGVASVLQSFFELFELSDVRSISLLVLSRWESDGERQQCFYSSYL